MAGTDRSQVLTSGGPRIILVEPQLGENIGAAARAMLNCGLTRLCLVNPREPWPNEKAVAMSSGAGRVLDEAAVFDTLADATRDLNRVYATTARPRGLIQRAITAREAAVEMRADLERGIEAGILFGPERSGLTNDQIVHADTVITIPLNAAYASLNLAQAVLLVGYELSRADFEGDTPLIEALPPPATKEELENFIARLEAALAARGYFPTDGMRPTMTRTLHTIFQRAGLSEPEIRTLHGVLTTFVEGRRTRRRDDESSENG